MAWHRPYGVASKDPGHTTCPLVSIMLIAIAVSLIGVSGALLVAIFRLAH